VTPIEDRVEEARDEAERFGLDVLAALMRDVLRELRELRAVVEVLERGTD